MLFFKQGFFESKYIDISMKREILMENIKAKKMLHQRKIAITGFQLEDGQFLVEGLLQDIRGHDMPLEDRGGCLKAGDDLHHMKIELYLNHTMEILAINVMTVASPYRLCQQVVNSYQQLVGIKIGSGWRQQALKRIGGVAGCTHLSELLFSMATVAFQTVWAVRQDGGTLRDDAINSCFAYQAEGEVVRRLQPKDSL